MNVTQEKVEGNVIIHLDGRFDFGSRKPFKENMEQAIGEGLPIILDLGFDPLWFGILFVVNMEIALITPPMGINFFLVRNNFNIGSVELLKGVSPFLIVLVLFLAIMVVFPQLSLWLPGMMIGR